MVNDAGWLLPEGVEEILPNEAMKLEMLRRSILDDLSGRGFQLVMPPVMEFVDSLLTGTGEELDTQTYKFMDQHTHRMLGIRADMTPQIARLDSHHLSDNEVNRLCYSGTVLRTQSDQVGGQRELLQVGAEMFGVESVTADIEVIDAMLAALRLSKAKDITLSLGHIGIYRELLTLLNATIDLKASESGKLEADLFDIFLRKSYPDLAELAALSDLGAELDSFGTLLGLQGNKSLIHRARECLPENSGINKSLSELQATVDHMAENHSDIEVHLDLADVFGYRYHTGLKFFSYVRGQGRAVAKGGRYDSIGEQFGRARPATGFSADLKSLVKLG